MARWKQRREALRAVLQGEACVHPASVHDPLSARIAEDIGFEVGMLGGSVASLAVLGAPDLILMTLTEFAEQAYRMARASSLPILADADHGYGNALNVMRTVEECEAAGLAGITIEDTLLPRSYGEGGRFQLISLEEGRAKIAAALEARQDPSMVIAGRTSAAGEGGLEDAMARAEAYAKEGADAIFMLGVNNLESLAQLHEAVRLPLIAAGTSAPFRDRQALAAAGVRICLQGHSTITAGVAAMQATLQALRDGADPSTLSNLASKDLMRQLTRAEGYEKQSHRYLD